MREILRSEKLPGPKFKYSPCVKAGPNYQFAGMVALDRGTGALIEGRPGVQTQKIMENLVGALPDFGLTLDDLYAARIFTTEFDRFGEINEAWNAFFEIIDPPARSAMGVCALPLGAKVEIEFTFYKE